MTTSFASLLCGEDNESILDEFNHEFESRNYRNHNGISGSRGGDGKEDESLVLAEFPLISEDCVAVMVEKDGEFLVSGDYLRKMRNGELNLSARMEVIDWIRKVHAHFRFEPLSSYLSISYLDWFLSVYELPKDKVWMMQLLAVACLSIAGKMDENEIPLSLDLQVGGAKYVFEATTIQRMELLVLTTLRWRMQGVTPFSFIDYFLSKMDDDLSPPRAWVSRSIQLILSTIKGIDFLEFRPSEIAAAVAISVASDSTTLDLEKSFSLLCRFVNKERVLKCVELMTNLGLIRGSLKGSSSSSSSVPQSPVGVLDAICWSFRSDDATTNWGTVSSASSPDKKRRKLDNGCIL